MKHVNHFSQSFFLSCGDTTLLHNPRRQPRPFKNCGVSRHHSRGNEKIGGTGYCVTYDTDSQSRNVLASPLGEEGHEVAKGWTVVRMIMILDADVTAEGGIIKLIAR